MDRASKILTFDEVVDINRRMIKKFGGGLFIEADSNLANPGSLEHVLEEAQGSLYGQVLFPTIIEKAALICWHIIVGHIFHDGNKRTGLEVCYVTLRLNGYEMQIDRDALEMALQIAKREVTLSEYTRWLERRVTEAK